jgi:hypothetical protein
VFRLVCVCIRVCARQNETSRATAAQESESSKLEGYLASEIESYSCPICYEQMVRARLHTHTRPMPSIHRRLLLLTHPPFRSFVVHP